MTSFGRSVTDEEVSEHVFKLWLQRKEKVDRASKLLVTLHKQRVLETKEWIAVGRALHAIDSKRLFVPWRQWTAQQSETLGQKCDRVWKSFQPRVSFASSPATSSPSASPQTPHRFTTRLSFIAE